MGSPDEIEVAPDGFLVFTWPGSNSPSIRAGEDLTYQAIRAERGFDRLEEVAQSLVRDDDFRPTIRRSSSGLSRPRRTTPSRASASVTLPRAATSGRSTPTTRSCSATRSSGFSATRRSSRAIELLNGALPVDDREADLQRQLLES